MVPLIKNVQINEAANLDPNCFQPDNPGHFRCTVNLWIGPAESEGMESFQVTVCSPSWLTDVCQKDGFVFGRHHLIVSHFDWEFITKLLTGFIHRCSGATWKDVAEKLSRIGYWEFEDYQPLTD